MPESRDGQEKTEQATPKKRREAIEEGNVAKTRELPVALLLLVSILFMYYYSGYVFNELEKFFYESWQTYRFSINEDSVYYIVVQFTLKAMLIFLPLIAILLFLVIIGNVAQFGLIITGKAIQPKWEKLNPIKGFQNLFSKRTLVELAKSILKIALVGVVAYFVVKGKLMDIASLIDADINFIIAFTGKLIFQVFFSVSLVVLIIAIFDFGYQKWQYEKDLMMSRSELKEELKQMEGDPLIRQRIRSIQREMARRRMMEEVPKADVVVTNPTHYAVAIKYDDKSDRAPKVIAKGQNLVALRIIEVARSHYIAVFQDPPLARLLYNTIDIGEEIPENLYKAIAEVLAFVYNLKKRA
jgi:flagellar biosynthetic protein FlhB